jgi:hypothetical protein
MNPGKLNLHASYFALRQTKGPSGAPRNDYAPGVGLFVGNDYSQASAKVVDSVGSRRTQEEVGFISHFAEWLEAGGRLSVEGKTYEIVAVNPPAKAAYRSALILTCRRLAGVTQPT